MKNLAKYKVPIAVLLVLLIVLFFFMYRAWQHQKIYDVSSSEAKSFVLTYNGEEYEYNQNISSVLIIGVDSYGDMEISDTYGDQARADNILLVSFNRENKRVTILPISRDTITAVNTFSAKGYDTGSIDTHLGFAYSYGNGGRASSMNVCDAVSNLLYGTEVYRYITTNIDSIAYANKLIGGVAVTVPNNDLVSKYPEMKKDAKVKLTDENVADFLRYRDTSKSGSNNGRMERQQAFMESYIEKLKSMSEDDYEDMWETMEGDSDKIETNMSETLFLSLVKDAKDFSYDAEKDNLKIQGEDKEEDGYDVFYPDKEKLKKLVVETYFVKLE